MAEKQFFTIGETVEKLQIHFPELSISKLRFLEDKGLIKPYRTSGGYRKYSVHDIERIRLLLKLQKEKFLPLDIIKEKLRQFNPELQSVETYVIDDSAGNKLDSSDLPHEIYVKDIPEKLGVPAEDIKDLESFGIIKPLKTDRGTIVNSTDIQIISLSRELSKFGIQPRHLRMYQNTAEREASFLEQILLPNLRQHNPEGRRKAEEALGELLQISKQFKHLLLKNNLDNYLSKL